MPFRIKVSLAILLALLGVLVLGPLLVPVPPLEGVVPAAELADPDSRFVEVDGVRLHVKEWGEAREGGVDLVLLHGFGSSTESWRRVAPELALYGRVVAFDRPAFGLSERPERGSWRGRAENPYTPEAQVRLTVGLMDALGIDDAVLMGNSAGGTVALQTALAHPERVEGLVLLGAAVYRTGGPPAWSRPLLATPQLERIGPLLMRQFGGRPGEDFLRSAWADPSRIDEETRRLYRRAQRVEGWDRALWELSKASRAAGLEDRLAAVRAPALVVAGAQDPIVPPELSERLARELDGATLALLEDCGHLPQEECPGPLLQTLEAWLAGLGGAGS